MTVGRKIIDLLIENEGRYKRILFMPYKVEMWDCLRSVYCASRQEGLDVKVCPLYYYTLIGNKLSERLYDDWYKVIPKDALIHSEQFDTYNPDIVILHYPFDYQNTVTTIDKRFYSAELKKRGKTIVYIPYHGSPAAPLDAKLPVVRNADYIFGVATNDIEIYPKDKKVYIVGSTKRDSLRYKGNTNDVLIINSIGPFISDKNRCLKYLNIVKANEGKTIYFRPHPLMMSTIQSICPERLSEYKSFLDRIQKLYGVKIDTSNSIYTILNRSSEIYCDYASIFQLCQSSGIEVHEIK